MSAQKNVSVFITNYNEVLDYLNQDRMSDYRKRWWRDSKIYEGRKNSLLREVQLAHTEPLTFEDWQEAYIRAVELAAFFTDNFIAVEELLKQEKAAYKRTKDDLEDLVNHNEQFLRVSEKMYVRQERRKAEDEWSNDVADSINKTLQNIIDRLNTGIENLRKKNNELREGPQLGKQLAWYKRAGRLISAPSTRKEQEEYDKLVGKQQIENFLLRDRVKELTARKALLQTKATGEPPRSPRM